MMMPRITVLIPTWNRAQYLFHTLRTCEAQDYDNLRIIVSDDGSSDNTKEVVALARGRDSRVSYITPGIRAGMKENFEFALNHVNDGYVLFLGSDDGILPGGIGGLARLIVSTGAKLITWNPPIFTYPGPKSKYGLVRIPKARTSRQVDSDNYLRRQALELNYIADPETPMFYVKGAASIELVRKVRSRSPDGSFYACSTPDGYSGIVLAGEVPSFYYEGKPFTIYGVSPTSQGSAYLGETAEQRALSQDFFLQAGQGRMSTELGAQPYTPLISVMTADYLLTARRLEGWPGTFGDIDFRALIGKAFDELANGLYSTSRLSRELNILEQIAEHNGLMEYFDRSLNDRWKFVDRGDYDSDGINPNSLFFSCKDTFIENILDAGYFCVTLNTVRSRMSLGGLFRALINSVRYKIRGRQRACRFADIPRTID